MDNTRPIVVLKFGGTSVSTAERWSTIATIVSARIADGLRPVVVCSALSGISNLMEELLDAAVTDKHRPILDNIAARHRDLAVDMGLAPALLDADLESLTRLSLGIALLGEVGSRVRARVMAHGELMSTRMGRAWLASRGVPATWIDARKVLTSTPDPRVSEARNTLSATCIPEFDAELRDQLAQHDSVITQGFIASDPSGGTVLLGRGGSDTSAAYLASTLDAARCEIWTDVPGMFTGNPRSIPTARLLESLDYDEAQEIATTGAKVLHPRCIQPLKNGQIPLQIRDTNHPERRGTNIHRASEAAGDQVKAISSRSGLILVSMETIGMWQQVGFLADAFAVFRDHGLSVDTVSTSESNVTVTLDPSANPLDPEVLDRLIRALSPYCHARLIRNCASVSLVGRGIRAILHKLAPVLELFEDERIHLVSQASSDLNLTFVVDEDQAERLVRRLHALLFAHRGKDGALGPTWQELASPLTTVRRTVEVPWWVERRDDLVALGEQSPMYVYDGPSLDEAASGLLSLSSVDRVLYSMKANSFPGVLQRLRAAGVGFECVSPGEVDRVTELFGALPPQDLLFTPNFASREEYATALAKGISVTLDNLHPIAEWPELFAGRDVFVRIDPGKGRGHHSKVRTAGARSKFGVSPDQFDELSRLVDAAGANVVGLHAHAGSGVLEPGSWQDTAIFLAEVAQRFAGVRTLDLGGGLGVPERHGQAPLDLDAVDRSLGLFKEAHPEIEIMLEPGRYLVAEAGVLLTRVTQLKRKGDLCYVGVDTGMNNLLRPALYGAWHQIVNLTRLGEPKAIIADVVGPICETGDVLGHGRRLPETRTGDVLLIATAGAYGRSMASQYNLRPLASELILP